ncbi:BadF/BadG/BcrA/BcrD ATPase family protein [Faecalibacterium sp. AF27-11BH]|uniref:BadF/BadG/BcrA/BcrD ATPase family protein n=1 Tax=Faecalibacterium sp. AF27-11BH TaxID=2302956 RepID=UPI001FA9DB22|nr:BadF/BadG/BcrA/BcrD ATPase family protein [Faecalibacterium sp. AF27-11BH]
MLSLGIDIGTSTVKLVLLKDKEIEKQWMAVHHGNPFVCLKKGLSTLELAMDTPFSLCVTGSNTEALLEQDSAIPSFGDIPAVVEGVRRLIPQVGSVIEIGSQGARFITDLQSRAPQFSVNEHCAGGTGSFFEDQMSRVGCKLEDYSSLVKQAQSVPRLSGRCAVFAKTDIIHRQQEGVSTPDILLGLCYAMIRNYKATIVRRLPVCKPVVFCGGVTCNTGVIRAVREVFGLTEEELIIPEFVRYEAALGAALKASGSFTLRQLNDSLEPCKKEILAKITLHYPEVEREAVWEQVQLRYAELLSKWRTDLGGKKNFHNGVGGTYDCIAIMCFYDACRDVVTFREMEEIEENLILPSFRKLRFVDINKPFWKKLMYRAFSTAQKHCDTWHDYEMDVAPYENSKPIYYEFTACPAAEFAKRFGFADIMPALCNVDYASMELLHAKLVRKTTCVDGCRCDYTICGDKDPYVKEHPEYRDENGYRRNKECSYR